MRRSAITQEPAPWDVEFDWHLTNRCNFSCEYCHPQIRVRLNTPPLNEPTPADVSAQFDALERTCLIHMSGGEPLLYPGFGELATRLTRRHFISMNTNMSQHDQLDVLIDRTDPARVVSVNAALHVTERERHGGSVTEFTEALLRLRSAGFSARALYILYPPLFDRVNEDLALMKSLGLHEVDAKVFKGVYAGKRYPESYTDAQKAEIVRLSGGYEFNSEYMTGPLQFKGEQCSAGRSAFKISVNGDVRRCASVATNYGNLYNGTFRMDLVDRPCPANRVLVLSQCLAYLVADAGTGNE